MQLKNYFLLLLLVVTGCSSQQVYDVRQERKFNTQRYLNADSWHLQGRLVLKGDDVLTASIQWQHSKLLDKLRLAGILGLGAVLITLDASGVTLEQGRMKKRASKDIEAFIAQEVGFVVPIGALRFWVLGTPLPGEPVKLLADGFEQLGWQIKYKGYLQTVEGAMPYKINVTKNSLKLKLVVDQWEIE